MLIRSKRFFIGSIYFSLPTFLVLNTIVNGSDQISTLPLEEKIPYSTVFLKSHYTDKVKEVEKLVEKKKNSAGSAPLSSDENKIIETLTTLKKESSKREPSYKEEDLNFLNTQEINKDEIDNILSFTNGTGFFYIWYATPDEELKESENKLNHILATLPEPQQEDLLRVIKAIEEEHLYLSYRFINDEERDIDRKLMRCLSRLKRGKERSFQTLLSFLDNSEKEKFNEALNQFKGNSLEAKISLMELLVTKFRVSHDFDSKPCRFHSVFKVDKIPTYYYKDSSKLFIVTNRHIPLGKNKKALKKSTHILFDFKITNIPDSHSYKLKMNCEEGQNIFYHPEYDICLMDISDLVIQTLDNGDRFIDKLHYVAFTKEDIPFRNSPQLKKILLTSPVYMTGYPKALYNTHNNTPVTRSGAIASPITENWNNKLEFLTDITVFNGSSGSPIFYLHKPITIKYDTIDVIKSVEPDTEIVRGLDSTDEQEVITELNETEEEVISSIEDEAVQDATRIYLLGALRASPMFPYKDKDGNPLVSIPMGLGFVVKSSVIEDFVQSIVRKEYKELDISNNSSLKGDEESSYSDLLESEIYS